MIVIGWEYAIKRKFINFQFAFALKCDFAIFAVIKHMSKLS